MNQFKIEPCIRPLKYTGFGPRFFPTEYKTRSCEKSFNTNLIGRRSRAPLTVNTDTSHTIHLRALHTQHLVSDARSDIVRHQTVLRLFFAAMGGEGRILLGEKWDSSRRITRNRWSTDKAPSPSFSNSFAVRSGETNLIGISERL